MDSDRGADVDESVSDSGKSLQRFDPSKHAMNILEFAEHEVLLRRHPVRLLERPQQRAVSDADVTRDFLCRRHGLGGFAHRHRIADDFGPIQAGLAQPLP